MKKTSWTLIAIAACVAPAAGATHRDWTAQPLGSLAARPGQHNYVLPTPADAWGPLNAPLALAAVLPPDQRQPLQLEVALGGAGERVAPTWTIERSAELYLIGVDVWREHAEPNGALPVRLTLAGRRPLRLMLTAAPDLSLAGADALGPVETLIARLPSGLAREYLHGLVGTRRDLAAAKRVFERLGRSSDPLVSRFARDQLRRIRLAELETRIEPDDDQSYRLGLYAQQCGFYRSALRFFAQTVRAESAAPWRAEAHYRLAECMWLCRYPIDATAAALQAAGDAWPTSPNEWETLVALIPPADEPNRPVPAPTASRIQADWLRTARSLYGATGGRLALAGMFAELPPVGGRTARLVEQRGEFDLALLLSAQPSDARDYIDQRVGPAPPAMLDRDSAWDDMLGAVAARFDAGRRASGLAPGCPSPPSALHCGFQPPPGRAYALLAAWRYHVPPAAYDALELADADAPDTAIRHWRVAPPAPHSSQTPLSPIDPNAAAIGRLEYVAGDADFIDLTEIEPAAVRSRPPCVTRAVAFDFSPQRRAARLWGRAPGPLAVWHNGALALAPVVEQPLLAIDAPRCTGVMLLSGWNRFDLATASTADGTHGFALRCCDFDNRPIPGLRVATRVDDPPWRVAPDAQRPTFSWMYAWRDVCDDYYRELPQVTAAGLHEYFGLARKERIRIDGRFDDDGGLLAISSTRDQPGRIIEGVPIARAPTAAAADDDMRLNNVLDVAREALAVYPFEKDGRARHLLVMRPEAVEAVLHCLQEVDDSAAFYGGRTLDERMLGWILAGEPPQRRVFFVADAILPTPLPIDEEDLLRPLR